MLKFAAGVVLFQREVHPQKVDPAMITQTDPDESFNCRNTNNIVSRHTNHNRFSLEIAKLAVF